MMQIIKITFLWLSGILLLSHSIVPHHHHINEQIQCADDFNHEHAKHNEVYNDCCQDNQAEQEICNLDQRTTIKDQHALLALLLNKKIQLANIDGCTCSLNHNYNSNISFNNYSYTGPSRAPPLSILTSHITS